jgi:hypothetical protein
MGIRKHYVLIDDAPGFDSPPSEWQDYLDLLTPHNFPDPKMRARMRREARRSLERSLNPEPYRLDFPPRPLG